MEIVKNCRLTCEICQKEFASTSSNTKHVRNLHKSIEKKNQRIQCPLCLEETKFSYYANLIEHLKQLHEVSIKECVIGFRNFEEFQAWRALENREVDYACHRRRKHPNGDEDIYYNCNRSDSKGFTSTCHKRTIKSGGSIRIQGICPSRIVAKIHKNGMVTVKFVETHVGHADELRSKRLSKSEQHTTSTPINFAKRREIAVDEMCRFSRSLDEDSFDIFMIEFNKIKNNFQQKKSISKKRKIEKQLYYPNKK